jgi:hypothetical protein
LIALISRVFCGRHGDHSPCGRPTEREEHCDTAGPDKRVDRPRLDRAVRFDVAKDEVLWIAASFEDDAEAFANRAVRPVAANEKPRLDHLLAAIVMPEDAANSIAAFFEGGEFDSILSVHASGTQMFGEQRLGFGLRDEQNKRETCIGRWGVAELHFGDSASLEVEQETGVPVPALHQPLAEAEYLKELQRARLHCEGARLAPSVVKAIDKPQANAELLESGSQGEPGRSGAHNEYIDVSVVSRHLA